MIWGYNLMSVGVYALFVWALFFSLSLSDNSALTYGTTTGNASILANLSIGFVGGDARLASPQPRVSICADELVLIPEDPTREVVVRELHGNVGVLFAGPFLDFGDFRVPPGAYRELRIHVGGCDSASTVVENSQGVFTSSDGFVLAWKERLEISQVHRRVLLPVNSVLEAAGALEDNSDVAYGLKRRSPDFSGPRVLLLRRSS